MSTENNDVFGDYSRYYDLLNQGKGYQHETQYIFNQIQKYCPNAQRALELGCGTGIHSHNLLKLIDLQIDGIDLSKTMLQMGKDRYSDPRFKGYLGDICTWRSRYKYDVVFSLFHVISYITSYDKILQLMLNISSQLNEHGVFLFDCWYGPGVLQDLPSARTREVEDDEIKVTRKTNSINYPQENRTQVEFDIEVQHKKSKKSNSFQEVHQMRYWFTPEIKWAAKQAGLKVIEVKDWLQEKEATYSSWNALFILQKEAPNA